MTNELQISVADYARYKEAFCEHVALYGQLVLPFAPKEKLVHRTENESIVIHWVEWTSAEARVEFLAIYNEEIMQ